MPEGPAQAALEAKAAEAPLDDDAAKFDSMNKMLMTLHLWDRPEVVFSKKTTTAGKTATTISDFATKISKLQDDFGKALVKAAQDFIGIPFAEGTSLSVGWAAMLKQTLFTGNQFVLMARSLQTALRGGTLKKIQATTVSEPAKKFTTSLAAARKTHDKEAEVVKKCKTVLDKFKDQNSIPKTEDSAWLETVAATLKPKATELDSAYKQAEASRRKAEVVLQQTTQSSLDEFQVYDGERVQAVNSFLSQIAEAQNKGLSASYKAGLATQRTIRGFQEAEDLKEFCRANESGNSCPWIETIVTVGDDGKMSFVLQEKGAAGAKKDGPVVWQTTNKSSSNKPHPTVNRTRVKGSPGTDAIPTSLKDHEISLTFSASFLPQMDVMSKSDPFVVVFTKDPVYETFSPIGRTETIMDDEDPTWGTKISFDPKTPNESLKLMVYDDDCGDKNAFMDLSKHDFIGEVEITVADLKASNPLTLPLKDKKGGTVIKGKGCTSLSTVTISSVFRSSAPAKEPGRKSAPPPPSTIAASATTTSAVAVEQKGDTTAIAQAKPDGGVDDTTRGDYIPDDYVAVGGDGGLLTPIVIDNGSAYFKAGFSGDRLPSYVVPGVVVHFPPPYSAGGQQQKSFLLGAAAQHIGPGLCPDPSTLDLNDMVFADQPSNWDDVELMWEYLFNRLGVDVQDHPVLLTQPTLAPLSLKTKMEEIMYEKFNCPAVYVAQAPLLSAYAYGHSSGLVVDVGHSSAQVIPIIDGYILDAHTRRVRHLGGLKDSQRIVQYFKDNTDSEDPLEASRYTSISHVGLMAQSIKDRMCACPASRDEYTEEMAVLQDVEGFLGGQDPEEVDKNTKPQKKRPNMLTLQKELITCGEVLFQPKELLRDNDTSILSLQELCRDVAMACDVDTRRTLLSNIFLSGQVTTMPGFAERLTQEIRMTIPHAPYVRVYGEERRYATWTGGSVLTGLDAFQDSWKFKGDWEEERTKS